jgi:hypothetical protein
VGPLWWTNNSLTKEEEGKKEGLVPPPLMDCVLTHLTHTQSFGVAHFCYCKINDDDEKAERQEAAGCSQVFPDI